MIDTEKCKMIAATLEPTPRFFFPKWLRKCEFLIDGQIYIEQENDANNDFRSFYDFLRSPKEIAGIRISMIPDEEKLPLIYNLKPGPGFKIIDSRHTAPVFEIYHGLIRSYCFEDSGDQFFGYNYILKNDSRVYAMTFGLLCLPPDEIQEIESWCENSR